MFGYRAREVLAKALAAMPMGFYIWGREKMYTFTCRTRSEPSSLDNGPPVKASGRISVARAFTVGLEGPCP